MEGEPMTNNAVVYGLTINIGACLGVIIVMLKSMGYIDWSVWTIFATTWIPTILLVAVKWLWNVET